MPPGRSPVESDQLSADLCCRGLLWKLQQKALIANTPFVLSWALAASPAPQPGPAAWADNDKGHVDQGWDQLRLETLARQRQLGVVPPLTPLTVRSSEIPARATIDPAIKNRLAQQMEIQAGFLAYADDHLSARVEGLADLEILETTLLVSIPGDAGVSGESSLQGTFNEITARQGFGQRETTDDDSCSDAVSMD